MAVIVPLIGEINMLTDYLTSASYRLRLYQNNYTPVAASVLGDFTAATFSGYAQATLAAGIPPWSTPADDGAGRALSFSTLITFANSTGAVGNNIYGYYIVDAGGTKLFWAERFAGAPIDMTTAGKTLNVVPVLTFKSEF